MSNPLLFRRVTVAFLLGLCGLWSVACDSGGKPPTDGGADAADAAGDAAATCSTACGTNAHCDTSLATPACVCDAGYTGNGQTCTAIPACSPACGAHATCQKNLACTCDAGFSGDPLAGCTASVPADACQPHNPCLNGGTCTVSGTAPGYTCACVGGATGANCETPDSGTSCGTYTDVVYALTARFAITGTPGKVGDQTFTNLTTNATTPPFQDVGQTTPFSRSPDPTPVFTRGFARLRYENDATGKPIAGTVRLVEYYVPLEFTQTNGASVVANTDHSVGLIDSTLANCGGGDPACSNHQPALARTCAANAKGLLVGRTLTWDACTPSPTGTNGWNFVMARTSTGAGCASGYNAFGNTTSTSPLVPASGKRDSYQTWNQQLQSFVFSGTDPMTATFTMPDMQIPNGTGASATLLAITGSTIVSTDCGTTIGTDLLCDVE